MMRRVSLAWLLCCAAVTAHGAPRPVTGHRFAVIGHSFALKGGEARLEQAIEEHRDSALAFVVATGIKGAQEPCSDTLYAERRELFDRSARPIIVAPAASDWSDCRSSEGRPAAVERLNRLRELFYPETASLGARQLDVSRLSSTAKFRSYAENSHWQVGKVLYATINLPSNNNHFLNEAGRNSEFEDRSVANRFWIKRLFTLARRARTESLVLFSEGDVKIMVDKPGLLSMLRRQPTLREDGFGETRRLIAALAKKFNGRVLLIDTAPLAAGAQPALEWRGNVGHLSVGSADVEIDVTPGSANLFALRAQRKHEKAEKAVKRDKPGKHEKAEPGEK